MKKAASQPAPPPSRSDQWIERIINLPRLTRTALAALFALALTLAVTPVVDNIYLSNFYEPDTRMYPAIVSTVLGLAYYLLGWRLIIGFAGETPPPRRSILWYFSVGAAACAIVMILVVIGAISGTVE